MVLLAIAIVVGVIKTVEFLEQNVESSVSGSIVRIAVGLEGANGAPPTNTGGDLPDVRVWNDNGVLVGENMDPGYVAGGNIGSVMVTHDNQNAYSLLAANNDAICIAWATVENGVSRGGTKYVVTGDIGRECGAPWYTSGMFPTADTEYEPACFWIDKNGDLPTTGFQVRWRAFSADSFDPNNPDDTNPQRFCNNIDFGLRYEHDPYTIKLQHREGPATRKRAAASDRASWMASQLVISDAKTNSANTLCESATSMGPDFAHVTERKFCDMGEKKLYDFCGQGLSDGCFNLESKTLVPKNARRGSVLPRLDSPYTVVRDWRKGGTASN